MKKSIRIFLLFGFAFVSSSFGLSIQNIKPHIVKYEGFSPRVYICPQGYKTAGWGTNLHARGLQNQYEVGDLIPRAVLETWLEQDLNNSIRGAKRVFPSFKRHSKEIQIVLVSFVYNVGERGATRFVKFGRALEVGDYKLAAFELKDSRWYKQVGNRGRDYVRVFERAGAGK